MITRMKAQCSYARPLGVLALGAVFSGMIWYGSFFGDHAQVNKFFGIPDHHQQAHYDKDHSDKARQRPQCNGGDILVKR